MKARAMTRPACMASDEYQGWLDLNAKLDKLTEVPCSDCIPAFALEMRAAGTCDGEPGAPLETQPCGNPHDDEHTCGWCQRQGARAAMIARARAKRRQAIEQAVALLAEGHSKGQVARTMGVVPSTVTAYIRDATP